MKVKIGDKLNQPCPSFAFPFFTDQLGTRIKKKNEEKRVSERDAGSRGRKKSQGELPSPHLLSF